MTYAVAYMSLAWNVRKSLIRERAPLTAENNAELRQVLVGLEAMHIEQTHWPE